MAGRRLNLGCGTSGVEGWVNLDGSWAAWLSRHRVLRGLLVGTHLIPRPARDARWPPDVVVHDLRRRLPFDAHTFDAIYGSHVLEHLYRSEARALLADCLRVLRPGGVLRIVVPDLAAIAAEYGGGPRIGEQAPAQADACERLNERLMLRSELPPNGPFHLRLYAFFNDFHSHKWVYDAPHLVSLFTSVGFDQAAPRGFLESAIEGIAAVERGARVLHGEGLCVEGAKPHERR